MKCYDVKIYIKDNIRQEDCIDLFLSWIKISKHYKHDTQEMANSFEQIKNLIIGDGYCYKKGDIQLTIISRQDSKQCTATACRFVNRDKTGEWIVSLVYFQPLNETPYLLIQQDFYSKSGVEKPKKVNRPYIVTKILEMGWIDSSKYLRFGNQQYAEKNSKTNFFVVSQEEQNKVVNMINGQGENTLPLVYFSYNSIRKSYGFPEWRIQELSKDLLGTAYVVKEPADTSLMDQITLGSEGKKAFRGYIGLYFPQSTDWIILSPHISVDLIKNLIWEQAAYNRTERDVTWEGFFKIKEWDELIQEQIEINNNLRAKVFNLEQRVNFFKSLHIGETILTLPVPDVFEKDTISEEEYRNCAIKSLKNGLIRKYPDREDRGHHLLKKILQINEETSFLAEVSMAQDEGMVLGFEDVGPKNEEQLRRLGEIEKELLNKQHALQARLSKYEGEAISLINIPNEEKEFVEGEFNDLIVLCLQETKKQAEESGESRIVEILERLERENPMGENGKKTMDKLADLISRTHTWNSNIEHELKTMGVEFVPRSKHHKAYYRGDSRYPIIFACTGSDYRTAQNTSSDAIKKISIYR